VGVVERPPAVIVFLMGDDVTGLRDIHHRLDRLERRGTAMAAGSAGLLIGAIIGGAVVFVALHRQLPTTAPAAPLVTTPVLVASVSQPADSAPASTGEVAAPAPSASSSPVAVPARVRHDRPPVRTASSTATPAGRPPSCPVEDWDVFDHKCRTN
jgi:hypothetical protein